MTKPAKSSPPQHGEILATLEARFLKHTRRHPGVTWEAVREKLRVAPEKLASLAAMENSGGEPDVVGVEEGTGRVLFFDCSPESPKGRVSLCYDREGLESRKEHRPANSAMDLAAGMGVELLTESEYRHLQTLGEFDTKTSSWVLTPGPVRRLGGALFCDRRYGQVFTYHNGAQSYYSSRGFRTVLRL